MNILLVADESAGTQTLRLLLRSGHTLSAVLTNLNKTGLESPVHAAAQETGKPLIDSRKVKEPGFAEWISSNNIDVLLNVHSLWVICPEVIQALGFGAFNLHPGRLPQYSGLNAPSWSIYNGEEHHSITLHQITTMVDAGDIIYESTFPIDASDTALTVSINCIKQGLPLIEQLLAALHHLPVDLPHRVQDLTKRRYFTRNQIPNNGIIVWEKTAGKIDAFIRACNYSPFASPWGFPKTRLGNKVISILKIELSDEPCDKSPGTVGYSTDGKIAIATGDDWVLVERLLVGETHVDADSILTPGDVLR